MLRMKKLLLSLLLLFASLYCGAQRLSVESYRIVGVDPQTMSSAGGSVELVVKNTGPEVVFSSIRGKLFYKGKILGTFAVDDVKIPAKASSTIIAKGTIALAEGWNFVYLLKLLPGFSLGDYSVSVSLQTESGGKKVRISKEKMSLPSLVHRL